MPFGNIIILFHPLPLFYRSLYTSLCAESHAKLDIDVFFCSYFLYHHLVEDGVNNAVELKKLPSFLVTLPIFFNFLYYPNANKDPVKSTQSKGIHFFKFNFYIYITHHQLY